MPDNPQAELAANWTQAGRVLRSVTHDVNNQLGSILAYAELIALAPERHNDTVRMARDIVAAVRQSTAMLDTAAALVAHDLVTVETINLSEVLARVVDLFRFELDRGGSGVTLEVPSEICVFPGVRTRIIRAIAHTLRLATDLALCSEPKGRVHSRLTRAPATFQIEIGTTGTAGSMFAADVPLELAEARVHLRYHHGDLNCTADGNVALEFPRNTGLIKPDH